MDAEVPELVERARIRRLLERRRELHERTARGHHFTRASDARAIVAELDLLIEAIEAGEHHDVPREGA